MPLEDYSPADHAILGAIHLDHLEAEIRAAFGPLLPGTIQDRLGHVARHILAIRTGLSDSSPVPAKPRRPKRASDSAMRRLARLGF